MATGPYFIKPSTALGNPYEVFAMKAFVPSSVRKKRIFPEKHIETMFLVNSFFKLGYPNVKRVPEIGSDD